jgi:Reverse transcriptase (RNA-dependent DNA polymerase)
MVITILLHKLQTSCGMSGPVYNWVNSYLTNRGQSVTVGCQSSPCANCTSGIPHGSVLGPIVFNIDTSPIATISSSRGITWQQHADDTLPLKALSLSYYSADMTLFTNCLTSPHSSLCLNGLALNPGKSDSTILGTRQRLQSYHDVISVHVTSATVPLADHVKLLGVILDSHPTMNNHASELLKSYFFHI